MSNNLIRKLGMSDMKALRTIREVSLCWIVDLFEQGDRKSQVRWIGYVLSMKDSLLPKELLNPSGGYLFRLCVS